MRQIKYLVVHCTATPQTTTVGSIQRYWQDKLKWKANGYHKIIEADGDIITLSPDDAICNGVAGYNTNCLHVSYVGGVDRNGRAIDNRTQYQKHALMQVLQAWRAKYPDAKIQGHRDFLKRGVNWKDCPSFDAKAEYSHI